MSTLAELQYKYFKSPSLFRAWLTKNHATKQAVLVGFYKTSSNKQGITYAEALDEALCFGWIDGVRKNVDEDRWSIRFSPRKPSSIWSVVNIGHVRRLTKLGRMAPAGLEVFRKRDKKKSKIYSYEAKNRPLAPEHEAQFKLNKKAWTFFCEQTPSYQKVARWWIIWAKKEETRVRRLNLLIKASAKGVRLDGWASKK